MVAVLRRSAVLLVALGWISASMVDGLALGKSAGTSSQAIVRGPQTASGPSEEKKTEDAERPLPDIAALMHAVETNQRLAEAIEKEYLYRSVVTEQDLDKHGGVKKSEVMEYEVFWADGVPVRRLVKKNGKELSQDEQKKESERIDKDAAKAKERRAKADAQGKESDARGDELMTASRALELGSFTNARRVELNGRDTIVADYAGNPKAKTRTRFEDVVRDLAGTVWVDEQDRMLVKAEGRFLNNFKVGGGLLVDIQKGTNFSMQQRKVNNEVWLPAELQGQGSARAFLFFNFTGRVRAAESDYRKFKATSTILPGMSTVEPDTNPK